MQSFETINAVLMLNRKETARRTMEKCELTSAMGWSMPVCCHQNSEFVCGESDKCVSVRSDDVSAADECQRESSELETGAWTERWERARG